MASRKERVEFYNIYIIYILYILYIYYNFFFRAREGEGVYCKKTNCHL